MANCKFCGLQVKSAKVFHASCWEHEAKKVAEVFCEEYFRWPRECADDDSMYDLHLHCSVCALDRLLNLGL